MTLQVNGTVYETDEEGYLSNLSDWNAELADAMATEDGCQMSEFHWEVVNFLREYYDEIPNRAGRKGIDQSNRQTTRQG